MKKTGGSMADIARALGRHRSTISKYRGRPWFDRCQNPDGSWNVDKAADAIQRNVSPSKQLSADTRHQRDSMTRKAPEATVNGLEAMWANHVALASVFGLEFDPAVLGQDFTEEQLQGHMDEGLDFIFGALMGVAEGKEPVKMALAAVLHTLMAIYNGKFKHDDARVDEIVQSICETKTKKRKVKK